VLKYRVPHGSQSSRHGPWRGTVCGRGLLAWTRGRPTATGVGSLSHPHHITRSYCSLARPPHTHSLVLGNFAHASRSDGPRNLLELQALNPAQPSALVLYCSDFTLTLLHTGRSLDHRNPTGAQRTTSARSGFLIVCCSDCTPASFPYAPASFTHSHTLSLDSCCRPTASKSSSPTGLSTLVYAYVVDCAPASPYAYSSSTHRLPDERTPIEATPL
jgi:hypothetical protein